MAKQWQGEGGFQATWKPPAYAQGLLQTHWKGITQLSKPNTWHTCTDQRGMIAIIPGLATCKIVASS